LLTRFLLSSVVCHLSSCFARIVADLLIRYGHRHRRQRLDRGHWLCFAKILRDPFAGSWRGCVRRHDLRRWLCLAKISGRARCCQQGSRRLDHPASHWLCIAKFTNGEPPPRKHSLLITVEPLELRQRGPVTGMFGVSGTKIGCVLQVALG